MFTPLNALVPNKILNLLSGKEDNLFELRPIFFLDLIEIKLKIEFTNKKILKNQVVKKKNLIYFHKIGKSKIISNSVTEYGKIKFLANKMGLKILIIIKKINSEINTTKNKYFKNFKISSL